MNFNPFLIINQNSFTKSVLIKSDIKWKSVCFLNFAVKEKLIEKIKGSPELVQFTEVIEFIEKKYKFTPTAFKNGEVKNDAGQNNGSCKIFAFGLLTGLNKEQTLNCFGDYYRKDVLENPKGTDHQNIRNFMNTGWEGIMFKGEALKART